MSEIEIQDGYPTDKSLEWIKNCKNFRDIYHAVDDAWSYPERSWIEDDFFWHLSTGGWSGNEDLIGAMQENTMFWLMCWVSSKRGGHFVFELKKEPNQNEN